jgi:hypothetical protein
VTAASQASQTGPGERGRLAFATPADWFAVGLPKEQVDADRVAIGLVSARPELVGDSETLASLLACTLRFAGGEPAS